MSREGIPLLVIQRQLGHADLAITSAYLRGIDSTEVIQAVHERPAPMIPRRAANRVSPLSSAFRDAADTRRHCGPPSGPQHAVLQTGRPARTGTGVPPLTRGMNAALSPFRSRGRGSPGASKRSCAGRASRAIRYPHPSPVMLVNKRKQDPGCDPPGLWLPDLTGSRSVATRMMTELRGASNAKAKRELQWRPAHPSWRQGFQAA
jgi:hypothetical protein